MSCKFLLANMLSSVANKNVLDNTATSVEFNKLVLEVIKIMKEEGYLLHYSISKKNMGIVNIFHTVYDKEKVLKTFKIYSKPSIRVYKNVEEIKHLIIRNPYKTYIFSTNKGVMNGQKAVDQNVGGEFLCELF